MKTSARSTAQSDQIPGCHAVEISIGQLVGQVFDAAPSIDRSRMLEHLLGPLDVLSLVAVTNGILSDMRPHDGGPDMRIDPDVCLRVTKQDIADLVDRLQLTGSESVDGLANIVAASPIIASAAAAVLLVEILMRRPLLRHMTTDMLA